MAAFIKSTFNAAAYLNHRVTYPTWVWDLVTRYHATGKIDPAASVTSASSGSPAASTLQPRANVHFRKALDLGCGPGLSTLALLPYFSEVLGIDPSPAMMKQALRDPQDASLPPTLRFKPLDPASSHAVELFGGREKIPTRLGQVDYLTDNAMDLKNYLGKYSSDATVPAEAQADLILAAQSAHWFTPYSSFLPLMNRVLRPGGTLFFLGYSDFFLPDYPHLTSPLLKSYSKGKPPPHTDDGIGEFWEQPGRSIVVDGLTSIPFPWEAAAGCSGSSSESDLWDRSTAVRHVFSTRGRLPEHYSKHWAGTDDAASGLMLEKRVDWTQFAGYLSTYSALHSYAAQNPSDGTQIAQRFVERVRAAIAQAEGTKSAPETVLIRWPLHIYAVKKR